MPLKKMQSNKLGVFVSTPGPIFFYILYRRWG